MNAALILKLIDLAVLIAQSAPGAIDAYNHLSAQIRAMISDGRDPTAEEWATLDAQTESLLATIRDS